jgi:hypothetical protein
MSGFTRWNIAVSSNTDQALRLFLATQGGSKKGYLSKFVEEAVRSHIFELTANQAKQTNADTTEIDLLSMIDEALNATRQ